MSRFFVIENFLSCYLFRLDGEWTKKEGPETFDQEQSWEDIRAHKWYVGYIFSITVNISINRQNVAVLLWKRLIFKVQVFALAEWLSWLEHCSIHQKWVGSIPGQGTYLEGGFDPIIGAHTGGNWSMFLPHSHQCSLSFSLSLSLLLSLKLINMSSGEDWKK